MIIDLVFTMGVCLGLPQNEMALCTSTHQLTFEGKRSGEGYFNKDGSLMVFQSERDATNPFYQIFLMDFELGDVSRISPGHGKTTCAWVHPNNVDILYASTHLDPKAREKQKNELDFRASGKTRRYSWDYDFHFDLFATNSKNGKTIRLTNEKGYDAEANYSPDGQWIVFSSNRKAYQGLMDETEAVRFEKDQSFMLDLYRMKSDGSNIEQLTFKRGYDGGPFYNHDGSKICWRRFSEAGDTAEIYVMDADGSNKHQLTRLKAMSWAPYFHPSGDYLIFTTNLQGYANFELYLVDILGKKDPVRVTYTKGFDGLPVFTPDGKSLVWTSTRTSEKTSQLFKATWNDKKARQLLGIK